MLPLLMAQMAPPSPAASALQAGANIALGRPQAQIGGGSMDPLRVVGTLIAIQREERADELERDKFLAALRKAKDEREDKAYNKAKDALTTGLGIFHNVNTNLAARTAMFPALQDTAKRAGIFLPPETLTRQLKKEDIDNIRKLQLNDTPDEVIQLSYDVSPQTLAALRPSPLNPGYDRMIAMLGGKTDAQLKKENIDAQAAELGLVLKEHGLGTGDGDLAMGTLRNFKTLYPGKRYGDTTATPQEREAAYTQAVLDQRERAIGEYKAKEQIRVQTELQIAQGKIPLHMAQLQSEMPIRLEQFTKEEAIRRAGRAQEKSDLKVGETGRLFVDEYGNPAPADMTVGETVPKGFREIRADEMKAINDFQRANQMLVNFKSTIDEMKKYHLFTEGSGIIAPLESVWKASKRYIGDPATTKRLMVTFQGQHSQLIGLLRALGDNLRAYQAFGPSLEAMSPASGAPANEAILGQVESELRAAGMKTRAPGLFNKTPSVFPQTGQPSPINRPYPTDKPATMRVNPLTGELEEIKSGY